MNMDDKIVVGDSGEGIAEVGVGTDEGVGEVHACTNVDGSDGAPATVIAVVTQNMSLREILTALRSALVPEALRSGKATPDYLTVIEVRVALLLPKQDGVSEAAVSERSANSKVLESTSPNAVASRSYLYLFSKFICHLLLSS